MRTADRIAGSKFVAPSPSSVKQNDDDADDDEEEEVESASRSTRRLVSINTFSCASLLLRCGIGVDRTADNPLIAPFGTFIVLAPACLYRIVKVFGRREYALRSESSRCNKSGTRTLRTSVRASKVVTPLNESSTLRLFGGPDCTTFSVSMPRLSSCSREAVSVRLVEDEEDAALPTPP